MPYGLLNETILDPSFIPLIPSFSLEGTHFDFEVWESLFRIGRPDEDMEIAFVVEGLRGLHLTVSEATRRGLVDGDVVDIYISTYPAPPTGVPPFPASTFLIQMVAHVHDFTMVAHNEESSEREENLWSPPVIGLCDILKFFDISFEGGLVQSDADGHLDHWEKKRLEDSDVIIVKKAKILRKCI